MTLNDPEKGLTEIRLTQRVKTFYVDKWPEIKDIDMKDTRGTLTHMSLASFLWDIGKQYSPRCDAAEHSVPSGDILFA